MASRSLTRTFLILLSVAVGTVCGETPDVLRSARAVRELPAAQVDESRLVLLRGVVLGLAEPQGRTLVLNDGTDSIYVLGKDEAIERSTPGDTVEVRGHAVAGDYAPFVLADSVRKTGTALVPEPTRVGLEELFGTGMDAQWISVTGVVRSLGQAEPSRHGGGALASAWEKIVPGSLHSAKVGILKLSIGDRLLTVEYYGTLDPSALIDAEVEIRGICFNTHNTDRQFLQPVLLVPRGVVIRVLHPPTAAPFALPVVSSSSLFQFRPEGLSTHRVHIDGVVLHQSAGTGIWIRDHGHGIFVRTEQSLSLVPGDVVQVAGFPERGEFAPILADAIFRKIGHEPEPNAVPIHEPGDEAFHNQDLVVTQGTLVDQQPMLRGLLLRVVTRGGTFDVLWDGEPSARDRARLQVGCLVSVTGLCLLSAERGPPVSGKLIPDLCRLVVRRPSDIVVLRPAPWWTMKHVAWLLGAVVAALTIAVITVFVVSRKKIAKERTLRALEVSTYSARLAERNQMARDLHDTVAQGLTAISLQLEVAVKPEASAEEVSQHVGLARDLIRSSMAEVRSFIRNLRTQTQQDVDLKSALEDILDTAVEGTSLRTEFHVKGEARKLMPAVEAQIIRVTHEAVSNAVQHSSASELTVAMNYLDKVLEVVIADNGRGLEQPPSTRNGRLHFGLIGMRERASLIRSVLVIQSSLGAGTRVTLSVPYDAVITDRNS